jgi:hypothetical protein
MYLAGILGLCALLPVCAPAYAGGGASFLRSHTQASQAPAQAPSPQTNSGQTPSAQPDATATPATTQTKPAPAKKRRRKKPSSDAQGSKKTVVRQGGTGDTTPQLTPAMNDEEVSKQKETTKQLLSATDVNLQKLNSRLLSKEEQDTVAQIHEFMDQAKTANSKGDLERATKLAAKAHLLSEALANP